MLFMFMLFAFILFMFILFMLFMLFMFMFIILFVIVSMFIILKLLLLEALMLEFITFDVVGCLGGLWLVFSKGLCTGVLRKLKRLAGMSRPMFKDELRLLGIFVVAVTTFKPSGPSGVGDMKFSFKLLLLPPPIPCWE